MKNYRKENYQNEDSILKRLEEIKKRPLSLQEEFKVRTNLKVIDYFLEHPQTTNEQLGQLFSISSSSAGRYLRNEELLKEFYLPETQAVIDEFLNFNRIEGRKKTTNSISEAEIRILVEEYMKEGASLSSVGSKFGLSKDSVYRRLTSDKLMSIIGKEKYYFLKEKMKSQDLDHKHLRKQSAFIEEKELIDKKGDKDVTTLAHQVEQQVRTVRNNYDTPKLSKEEAIQFRLSEKVTKYAEKFIDSKDSYGATCKKYNVEPAEMAELFFTILANGNMNYYTLLVNKYPYLKEYEELKVMNDKLKK